MHRRKKINKTNRKKECTLNRWLCITRWRKHFCPKGRKPSAQDWNRDRGYKRLPIHTPLSYIYFLSLYRYILCFLRNGTQLLLFLSFHLAERELIVSIAKIASCLSGVKKWFFNLIIFQDLFSLFNCFLSAFQSD